jgi:hypothetical protein
MTYSGVQRQNTCINAIGSTMTVFLEEKSYAKYTVLCKRKENKI